LDWPLRLLVVPAMFATLLTQATPDGRSARRYVASWIGLQLRPPRRSAGRPLPVAGVPALFGARLWVAADQRSPWLSHGRVSGPATAGFARAMLVRPAVLARRLRIARPVRDGRRQGRRAVVLDTLTLDQRERLEVRP
jgi:hypothetical protein